jgi:hypothetical protein
MIRALAIALQLVIPTVAWDAQLVMRTLKSKPVQ